MILPAFLTHHSKSKALGRESEGLKVQTNPHPHPRVFPCHDSSLSKQYLPPEASLLPWRHKQLYKKPCAMTQAEKASWRK